MKLADLRDMFKKASKSVCTSTAVVSRDPLSHTSATSLHLKTPQNTEEDPNAPEPADEGGIEMEYSAGRSTAQV
jgi:hypothetical protein